VAGVGRARHAHTAARRSPQAASSRGRCRPHSQPPFRATSVEAQAWGAPSTHDYSPADHHQCRSRCRTSRPARLHHVACRSAHTAPPRISSRAAASHVTSPAARTLARDRCRAVDLRRDSRAVDGQRRAPSEPCSSRFRRVARPRPSATRPRCSEALSSRSWDWCRSRAARRLAERPVAAPQIVQPGGRLSAMIAATWRAIDDGGRAPAGSSTTKAVSCGNVASCQLVMLPGTNGYARNGRPTVCA
jgi:hypothetical protein